jgi:UDP-2,3-diacylglucosamine hydrolase
MSADALYFFSDAHLGARDAVSERPRTERLHRFLGSLPGRARHLYIVGDLFDFWFEYRTAIPRRHFDTLAVLRDLRRVGIGITYLNGNHDFWLGRFLAEEIGVTPHEGALVVEAQGRRLWVHHGDGLLGGDLGYKALRAVLRNPLSIRLYQLIHPDLGIPLALWVSGLSRHSRQARFDGDQVCRDLAGPRFAAGYDGVIVGHFHHPFHARVEGRDFFVLGDWIEDFDYVVLEGGVMRREVWPAG